MSFLAVKVNRSAVLGLMLIGSLMAISSVSTMTVPVIVGQIANKMSFGIFPYVIAICIAVLTTAYSFLYRSMIEAGT